MACQNRWRDDHQKILWEVAEELTDEQCQKLVHKLGVHTQRSPTIYIRAEPVEQRFLRLQSWYQTSGGTPVQLATCLADLDDIPGKTLTHLLTILPLNLDFPFETKLVQLARTIPERNWNRLLEKTIFDENRRKNIVDELGQTRLMVIVLLHYVPSPKVPDYVEQMMRNCSRFRLNRFIAAMLLAILILAVLLMYIGSINIGPDDTKSVYTGLEHKTFIDDTKSTYTKLHLYTHPIHLLNAVQFVRLYTAVKLTKTKGMFDDTATIQNLKEINLIDFCDMLNTSYTGEARRIILKGEPSVGKSELLKFVAYSWANESATLPCLANYDYVLRLQLRGLEPEADFYNVVAAQIFHSHEHYKVNVYQELKSYLKTFLKSVENKLLILLDSYDEMHAMINLQSEHIHHVSLKDVIQGIRFKKATTVITTRTDRAHKLLSVNGAFNVLSTLHGFSKKNQQKYVYRYFKHDATRAINFLQKSRYSGFRNMMRFPLLLMMGCFLWAHENQLPETKTKTYETFVYLQMMRCREQKLHVTEFANTATVEIELGKVLHISGQVKLESLSQAARNTATVCGLISEEIVPTRIHPLVSLLHHTFADYYIACYIASVLDINPKKLPEFLPKLNTVTDIESISSSSKNIMLFTFGKLKFKMQVIEDTLDRMTSALLNFKSNFTTKYNIENLAIVISKMENLFYSEVTNNKPNIKSIFYQKHSSIMYARLLYSGKQTETALQDVVHEGLQFISPHNFSSHLCNITVEKHLNKYRLVFDKIDIYTAYMPDVHHAYGCLSKYPNITSLSLYVIHPIHYLMDQEQLQLVNKKYTFIENIRIFRNISDRPYTFNCSLFPRVGLIELEGALPIFHNPEDCSKITYFSHGAFLSYDNTILGIQNIAQLKYMKNVHLKLKHYYIGESDPISEWPVVPFIHSLTLTNSYFSDEAWQLLVANFKFMTYMSSIELSFHRHDDYEYPIHDTALTIFIEGLANLPALTDICIDFEHSHLKNQHVMQLIEVVSRLEHIETINFGVSGLSVEAWKDLLSLQQSKHIKIKRF